MKKKFYFKILMAVPFLFLLTEVHAQLEFKLQLMQDTSLWGVYVRHDGSGGSPSGNTITGSGQVTIVAPTGFTWGTLTSVNGTWSKNARVDAPIENPARDYISVGFQYDSPVITYSDTAETLLFTFSREGACPDTLYLIDNNNDPFNVIPNSAGTNPGNDLGVYDVDSSKVYNWSRNYAYSAWSCHDCDEDGYLNGIEDTNGDGTYTVGVDTTDMCVACDPIHPSLAEISGDTIMCSAEDNVPIFINITSTHDTYDWSPYTVVYEDKDGNQFTVNNYNSGDAIVVTPSETNTYTIVSVTDSKGCTPDTIRGSAIVTVEGPLTFTDHPDDITECAGNSNSFAVVADNAGDGTMYYNWQISTDDVTFTDLDNGTPYTGAFSNTLEISDVTGLNANYYRVKIYSSSCDTVFSNSAQLTEEGPITISQQPGDSTRCDGESVTFISGATATLGTVNTVWQVSEDGGSHYSNLTDSGDYSGTTTNTLAISDVSNKYDYQYRLAATTSVCDTVFSDWATLTVEGPIAIAAQPSNVEDCGGQAVNFTVGVTNGGSGTVTYQWQQNDGSGWANLTNNDTWGGVRTDTLVADISDSLDGTWVRVVVSTGECTAIVSDSAQMTIDAIAEYTLHPSDTAACYGDDVFFAADATVQQGSFTYQWQVSDDDGSTWADLSNDATYSGVTTDRLDITSIDTTLHNYQYRVQAITGNCDPESSNAAVLTVEGPVIITSQPDDFTLCKGEQAVFEVGTYAPNSTQYNYQWELSVNGGASWNDVTNGDTYSGVQTERLTVNTDQGGLDQTLFRVQVSTNTCDAVTSASATLTIEGPININSNPEDVTVCAAEDVATFSATVSNPNSGTMTYQWEVKRDGENPVSVSGSPYSGETTTTLTISDVSGLDGDLYRLKISTGECGPDTTAWARLTVEGPIAFTDEPDDLTACADANAEFVGAVSNAASGVISYRWQIRESGSSSWTVLSNNSTYNGVRSDTLSIRTDATMDGDSLRLLAFTGTCDTIISGGAKLTIEGPLTFPTEARDTAICSGEDASFTIAWDNPGAGTPLLQWEVSQDSGSTWASVTNSGIYSGANSVTLALTGADSTYHTFQYRMAATLGTCGTVYSEPATLTIEGPLNFTDQPDDVTACSADDVYFQISISNGSGAGTVSYQWQVSTDDGSTWADVSNGSEYAGANSPILGVGNTGGKDGNQYRVRISSGECSYLFSSAATLTVEGPLTYSDQPADQTVCSGEGTTISATVANGTGNGTIVYQWQSSSSQFTGYSDISGGVYSDETTATLTISDVADLGDTYFRLSASTNNCDWVYSEGALLTVEGPLSIDTQPRDLNECNAKSVLFTVEVSNSGSGIINYQWERSRDGGSTWADITGADTTFNGVRTDSLSLSDLNADSLNDDQFRVRVWTATCNTITSSSATLTIEGPLFVIDQPNDTTVCDGEPAYFTIEDSVGYGGTVEYEWQTSTNGVIWTSASGGVYSDFNTATLQISDVTGLGGRRYRARIRTGECDWVYSDRARLTVEGPVTFNGPDTLLNVCANTSAAFESIVTNTGSGVMSYQWEVSTDDGSTWADVDSNAYYTGVTTTRLNISQVADSTEMVYFGGNVYRLRVNLPTCNAFYSDTALLQVVTDTSGHCDFDLDGLDNDTDLDDDNDGIPDTWEYSCLEGTHNYDTNANNDGEIDGDEDHDNDQISTREELNDNGVLDGDPCDPCDPLISRACFGIAIKIKVLMYGAAFDGVANADTLMKDSLRTKGLIPLKEPYSNLSYLTGGGQDTMTVYPYTHVGPGGGETITDSSAVLGVEGPDAIVDWVFVELRSANKIDSVIATRSALIQRDGDIVDVDGTSDLTFDTTVVAGPHYVAVRHRNHLGIMTINAPELSPEVRAINFRDSTEIVHGAYPVRVRNNKNYMWAGDLRPDSKSIYQGPKNDIFEIFAKVLTAPGNDGPQGANANYILYGYLNEDFDLDGKAIYQGPKNDRIMVLLQTILPHSGNENTLANFIVVEQLP